MRFRKQIGWLFVVLGVWAGYALSADMLVIFARWLDAETGLVRLWAWLLTWFAPMFTFACFTAVGVVCREGWLAATTPTRAAVPDSDPQDPGQR